MLARRGGRRRRLRNGTKLAGTLLPPQNSVRIVEDVVIDSLLEQAVAAQDRAVCTGSPDDEHAAALLRHVALGTLARAQTMREEYAV